MLLAATCSWRDRDKQGQTDVEQRALEGGVSSPLPQAPGQYPPVDTPGESINAVIPLTNVYTYRRTSRVSAGSLVYSLKASSIVSDVQIPNRLSRGRFSGFRVRSVETKAKSIVLWWA